MRKQAIDNVSLPDFGNCAALVVGDVILDQYIWGDVSRISPEAPVQIVRIDRKSFIPGGAGNVASNLAGLGCRVVCLGVRGNDESGRALAAQCESRGIEHRLLEIPSRPTTTKTRVMGQGQQLLRLDDEQSGALPDDAYAGMLGSIEQLLPEISVVILSDYGKGVFLKDMAQEVIGLCKKVGVPVFVDPKGADWQRYQGATCITPNTNEFLQVASFSPDDDADLAARADTAIAAFSLDNLVVTRGPKGLSLFGRKMSPLHIPTQAKEVFDVSGAGDTVIATMAACHGAGLSMEESAHLANIAAGIVVGKLGTQPIARTELDEELRRRENGFTHKIRSWEDARELVASWQEAGENVVFTNGCFDLLHVGHIKVLHSSAEQGDKLIVGINSDASVKRLKGESRPILPENERAALIAALECVDLVVLFQEDTPRDLISTLKPNILVKGGDYTVETVVGHDLVQEWGGAVVIVPLLDGKSTTSLIERLQGLS